MREYPLYLSGMRQGSLCVWEEGLYTCFEARSRMQPGLLRLSVYGQGHEGYLGVMKPWSGGGYLFRKLSRQSLAAFPAVVEYAAEAGAVPTAKASAAPAEEVGESMDEAERPETETEGIWLRCTDGTLLGHDGKNRVLALPAKLRKYPQGIAVKQIEGQWYMLFRY